MNGISIPTKYVRTLYSECYIEKKEGGWRLMSGRCRQTNRVLNLVHHPPSTAVVCCSGNPSTRLVCLRFQMPRIECVRPTGKAEGKRVPFIQG